MMIIILVSKILEVSVKIADIYYVWSTHSYWDKLVLKWSSILLNGLPAALCSGGQDGETKAFVASETPEVWALLAVVLFDLSRFLVVDILPMLALGLVPPLQFSVPVCLERKITASASGQLHHTFGFWVLIHWYVFIEW